MVSSRVFPEWLAIGGERVTEIKISPDGKQRLARTVIPKLDWQLTAHEAVLGPEALNVPTLAVEKWRDPETGDRVAVLATETFQASFSGFPELVASQGSMFEDGRMIPSNIFILGPWSLEAESDMLARGVRVDTPDPSQVDFQATAAALEAQFAAGDFSRPPQIILKSP